MWVADVAVCQGRQVRAATLRGPICVGRKAAGSNSRPAPAAPLLSCSATSASSMAMALVAPLTCQRSRPYETLALTNIAFGEGQRRAAEASGRAGAATAGAQPGSLSCPPLCEC